MDVFVGWRGRGDFRSWGIMGKDRPGWVGGSGEFGQVCCRRECWVPGNPGGRRPVPSVGENDKNLYSSFTCQFYLSSI